MKFKTIGFPIKDGCRVEGSDKGINVLKDYINFDEIIEIEKKDTDLETVIHNDLKLAKTVDNAIKEGLIPVTIGGDHSLAIGSIAGSSVNNDIGVLWIDTHPDSNNNKTTVTFRIHGYPLGASMGFGQEELTKLYSDKVKVDYKNVVMFGINDIDEPEQELIDKYNIKTFSYDYIREHGIHACINEAINYLNSRVSKVHVSFDIDSITPLECPGVNVPNRFNKGITKNEALLTFKEALQRLNVQSIDIVEYNPLTDKDNKSLDIVLEAMETIKKVS